MIVIFGTVFFLYKLDLVSMTFIVGRMVFSIQIQHDDSGIHYFNLQTNHKVLEFHANPNQSFAPVLCRIRIYSLYLQIVEYRSALFFGADTIGDLQQLHTTYVHRRDI